MNYRALGRTGLVVSEIGFGAWGIGGRTVGTTSYGDTDDGTSLAALQAALDAGITFFDTSSAYGNGHSEELIGQAFKGARSKVIVATKAGYEAWDRPPDFSAAAITASAEASLRRLGGDTIDLLQLHNAPTAVLQAPDVREALAKLLASGKIRAWGASTKSPAEAIDALRAADVGVVQANFNMMDVRARSDGLFDEVANPRQASSAARRSVSASWPARSGATPSFPRAIIATAGRAPSSTTGSTVRPTCWPRCRRGRAPRALRAPCASVSRSPRSPASFPAS